MNPKPKILFVVQLPPPIHGVSAMNLHAVNNPLWKDQYRVKTLPLDFGQRLIDLGKITPGKLVGMVKFFFKLCYTLTTYRPKLVYFTIMPTGASFLRDALFTFVIKLFCSKVIFHLHGKGIDEAAQESKWKRWLYRRTFKGVNVICLSERLTRDIKRVAAQKPFILPNGIEVQNGTRVHNRNQVPVVIYLSNLGKTKGIEVLLNSFVQLRQRNVAFKGVVVGDSADYTIEEAVAFCKRSGLEGQVDILGPKFGAEKAKQLCLADVFVLPSFNECFPLTILEAMQVGLPVVATEVGGIPDLISNDKDGLLVRVNDQEDLSRNIERLLTDEALRRKFGISAKEKFFQKYTIDRFQEGLADIFRKVLAE